MSSTWLYCTVLSCIWLYWAVLLNWAVLGCIGQYWAVPGCIGMHWDVRGFNSAVVSCTGFYWAVLGCTGLHWAVLGCTGLKWTVLGWSRWSGCSAIKVLRTQKVENSAVTINDKYQLCLQGEKCSYAKVWCIQFNVSFPSDDLVFFWKLFFFLLFRLNHGESIFLAVKFLFNGRIVPKEKFFRRQRKMSFGRWLDWFLPAIMLWQALPRKVDRRFFVSNLIELVFIIPPHLQQILS